MEDHEQTPGGGPRREVSASTLAGREARLLVTPTNQKLGEWQAASIKMETIARRHQAAGRHDPVVTERVQALRDIVAAETAAFEAIVAKVPEAVRLHSRVGDTRQALRALEARLAVILADPRDDKAGR